MDAFGWPEVERHARTLARVEAEGMDWVGLVCSARSREPVRLRLERLTIADTTYVGAVTGGRSAQCMALAWVIAWNARLLPGCTVLIEAGRLWLRFLIPLARLTPARVKELVTFVVREGAPLGACRA